MPVLSAYTPCIYSLYANFFLYLVQKDLKFSKYVCMYDVIYEVEIALCNINKDNLQLNMLHTPTKKLQTLNIFLLQNAIYFSIGCALSIKLLR
jgi:hypothetical protein